MFNKRNHVVDQNGKITQKSTVDHYLKSKKSKIKPILIFLGLAIIAVVVWVGATSYGAYKKIINKNNSGSAPFLEFLNNVSPDKLKGEGDGRINILLLGNGGDNHPGGQLTDTILVASIDPNNKKIAMLSIPRDLYVEPGEKGEYGGMKINQVYYTGEENKEATGGGPELMKATVSDVLDLPIHYYIKMDFSGFTNIVDELGGLDVTVANAISDPYYPAEDMIGYEPFYIEAGSQHLNGTVALKYARSRETTSDFDRSARQQQLLIAIKDKTLSLGFLTNPSKITGVIDVLGDHLRTDIQLDEMQRLASILKDIDTSTIVSKVLDNSADGPLTSYDNGGYYLAPKLGINNYTQIQQIAHEIFTDPYLQKENARLEVLNGTSQTGLGKEISDFLTSYGYNIVNLDKSDKEYAHTTIYDYSGGKFPYTINYLKDRYNAEVIDQPTTKKSGVDITIIVGDDYYSQ